MKNNRTVWPAVKTMGVHWYARWRSAIWCKVPCPVNLQRKSSVTRLIVKFYNEGSNHSARTHHTLSLLSVRFWIVQAREWICEVERECCECRRRKAKAATQIMAPLPKIRLKLPLRAFARTSVDFAGRFVTLQGRGKRNTERYLRLHAWCHELFT